MPILQCRAVLVGFSVIISAYRSLSNPANRCDHSTALTQWKWPHLCVHVGNFHQYSGCSSFIRSEAWVNRLAPFPSTCNSINWAKMIIRVPCSHHTASDLTLLHFHALWSLEHCLGFGLKVEAYGKDSSGSCYWRGTAILIIIINHLV